MSYQEIVEAILHSRGVRIPYALDPASHSGSARAIAFESHGQSLELTLKDKGGYLELNVVPVLEFIGNNQISEWPLVFDEIIQYVELKERWFLEEPSRRISRRFAGFRIIGGDIALDVEVDDDMIGGFIIKVQSLV